MGYIAIFFLLGVMLGALIGYALCIWHERKTDKAPVPDFDRNNPVNSSRGKKVIVNGYEWTRMN